MLVVHFQDENEQIELGRECPTSLIPVRAASLIRLDGFGIIEPKSSIQDLEQWSSECSTDMCLRSSVSASIERPKHPFVLMVKVTYADGLSYCGVP